MQRLEPGEESILALAITTSGICEFVFYAKNAPSVKTMILMLQTTIKSHPIQCYTAEDPGWGVYKSFANRGFPPSA